MREAYPGAVYYYTTKAFRVYRVDTYIRHVQVRNEKKYTTTPTMLPVLVFPNLTTGNIHRGSMFGNLCCVECNLQIREIITGFKEKRGLSEFVVTYPIDLTKVNIFLNNKDLHEIILLQVSSYPILYLVKIEWKLANWLRR